MVSPTADNDCSDLSCDLQSALTLASGNGEDDTLVLAEGVYHITPPLTYISRTDPPENFSLSITGPDSGMADVDLGAAPQILNFDTSALHGTDSSNLIFIMKKISQLTDLVYSFLNHASFVG